MRPRRSTTRGFKRTATLLNNQIRQAGESRGFAVSRLLTHWAEIVGQDIAAIARPVKVGYGKGGIGATLTLLTTGPQAPMLEMQKEQLRGKVNAVYGYNAISRVHITQTASTGFAEGQASFDHKPKPAKPEIKPEIAAEADKVSRDVNDGDLRAALESLGRNVLSRQKR
nr:DciA family protein [uncultured Ruegeria sp.]